MGQMDYNQTQEYYGEYKQGFFGATEQIFVCFSAKTVSGRGLVYDNFSQRFDIVDFEYQLKDVNDVVAGTVSKKACTVLKVTDASSDAVYLPGLNVMPPMIKNTFTKFKELAMEMEAENFKKEAFSLEKSSENLSLEEEMAEFKEKVDRLKLMRDNGVLSPLEYQELKTKLMDLYN